MVSQESPEREKPEEKTKAALKKARKEVKAAQTKAQNEEKARLKAEAAETEAQKLLATAQAEAKKEHEARVKAEKKLTEVQEELEIIEAGIERERQARAEAEQTLAKAQQDLEAGQAKLKQEHAAQVESERIKAEGETVLTEPTKATKFASENIAQDLIESVQGGAEQRVTFIVRVTADDKGQPRRTEIEHAQSKKIETIPALDSQQLVAFIKAYLTPTVLLKPTVPSKTPLATVETPPPESSERAVSLTISDVQIFRIGRPGVSALIVKSDESFVVQSRFKLGGAEALSLTAQEPDYEIRIHAYDITRGSTSSLTMHQGNLVKDLLEYTVQAQAPGLTPGLYRLVTRISLQAPTKLVGYYEGPIVQVGQVQPSGEMTIPEEVAQPQ